MVMKGNHPYSELIRKIQKVLLQVCQKDGKSVCVNARFRAYSAARTKRESAKQHVFQDFEKRNSVVHGQYKFND